MSKPEILCIGPFDAWTREQLDAAFTVHRTTAHDDHAALSASARAVTLIALMGHAEVNGSLMDHFPKLETIVNFGVGFDAINIPDATARGIKVTNTPDVLNDEVADLAVGMIIAQQRKFAQSEAYLRQGDWINKGAFPLTRSLAGKRVGVVGLGRIGREIADRLAAFKMQISYSSRAPKDTPKGWGHFSDVEELARDSDFLVVALAGGPATRHMVSKDAIEALGPEGMLVNISRGSTVDEPAMIGALKSGALGAAALDVFENEPNIDPAFLELENVLLLPHVGSASVETRQAMGQLVLDNALAHFAGKPLLTPVN